MMLYYHSWMFYNHFISFFGTNLLTYCQVPVVVFPFFYIAKTQYQTESKCHETLRRIFMVQKEHNGLWLRLGVPRGRHNPPGRAWAPKRAQVGCAPLGSPSGTSLAQLVFWSQKNLQKVLLRLDSVCY